MIPNKISSIFAILFIVFSSSSKILFTLPEYNLSVRSESDYASFNGSGVYAEPGEPALPLYTYTFLLPPYADLTSVQVSIRSLSEELLIGEYKVKPGPPLAIQGEIFWPEGKNIVDGKDIDIYSSNSFFPQSYAKITSPGKMWRYTLVQVEVNPYRYNPVTKKLKYLKGGELLITYSQTSDPGTGIRVPYGITRMVRKLAINYNKIANRYSQFESLSRAEKRGLAIITTSEIESGSQNLQAYIDSKVIKGYEVHMVPESEWNTGSGDKPDKIRNWIKSNYEEKSIEFLLLIGDPTPSGGDVPMKTSNKTPTEWYYGELSGSGIDKNDVYAEVHVGRIPVYDNGDIEKLDNIILKTIAYENADRDEIDWRFKALLAMKPIDDRTQAYELGEQIKDSTLVSSGWEYYRIYGKDYSLNPPPDKTPVNSTNTQNAWKNEKPGCVFWDTHGSSTSSSGIIKVSEVSDLDDNHPVFTFQGACDNADPDADNNLCYSLLVHGAIVTHGGTISVSYSTGESDYTNTGSIGGQNYWYAEALIQDSLTAAESIDFARIQINGKKWANHLALILYGCPTMNPYDYARLPHIDLVTPQGGFEWEQGRTFDIIWNTNAEGEVKIELLKADVVDKTLSAATSAEGLFSWAIPDDFPLGADYKIRVTSLTNDTLIVESNGNFSITKKSILALKTPNGSDYIEKDSEAEITWEYNFDYDITLLLYNNNVFETVICDSMKNAGTFTWKVPNDIPSGIEYKVRITSIKKPWLFDESDSNFAIQNPAITEFPYVQDFDEFEDSSTVFRAYWEQLDDDDLQWTVWTGMTPTKYPDQGAATGPDADHTSGSGNYLYVESSGSNNPDKKAHCITPLFNLGGLKEGTCLFWYHMFSDNEGNDEMGDFYIDVGVDGTWEEGVLTFSGDKGDEWHETSIDLKDYVSKMAQFRFRAVTGSGWASDICIDDFEIKGVVNKFPVFTSTFDTSAMVGTEYVYKVEAKDDDGDPLTIEGTALPSWLSLSDNGDGTAELKGTPATDDIGANEVVLTVNDGFLGNPVVQEFIINVEEQVGIIHDVVNDFSRNSRLSAIPNPTDRSNNAIVFHVDASDVTKCELKVLDAVCNTLFHTDVPVGGERRISWDLRVEKTGSKVHNGVYVAVLFFKDVDGNAKMMKLDIGVKE